MEYFTAGSAAKLYNVRYWTGQTSSLACLVTFCSDLLHLVINEWVVTYYLYKYEYNDMNNKPPPTVLLLMCLKIIHFKECVLLIFIELWQKEQNIQLWQKEQSIMFGNYLLHEKQFFCTGNMSNTFIREITV